MKKPTTVDEYLADVPEPAKTTLSKVRESIRAAAPRDATEGFSYGVPAFIHKKAVAGYAAFANHCAYFPMSAGVIEELKDDLTNYETSKGGIKFPSNKPLPAALIKKLVKARLAEIETKKSK